MRKYLLFILILVSANHLFAQSGYKLVNTYHIQSTGWWDYIAVHGNRLYVSHGQIQPGVMIQIINQAFQMVGQPFVVPIEECEIATLRLRHHRIPRPGPTTSIRPKQP